VVALIARRATRTVVLAGERTIELEARQWRIGGFFSRAYPARVEFVDPSGHTSVARVRDYTHRTRVAAALFWIIVLVVTRRRRDGRAHE
jgi:hypothetical protein